MTIVLLASNPVLSRLFALVLEEEGVTLHRIHDATQLPEAPSAGTILAVEDLRLDEAVEAYIAQHPELTTLFIGEPRASVAHFDALLPKPFLPSELKAVLSQLQSVSENETEHAYEGGEEERERSISLSEEEEEGEEKEPSVFDPEQVAQIKALLEQSEEEPEPFEEEELQQRKIEAIKESLIAEGLEIVDEEEIVKSIDTPSNATKEAFLSEENKQVLLMRFERYLQHAKPKKIRKLLMGKKVKIKL